MLAHFLRFAPRFAKASAQTAAEALSRSASFFFCRRDVDGICDGAPGPGAHIHSAYSADTAIRVSRMGTTRGMLASGGKKK